MRRLYKMDELGRMKKDAVDELTDLLREDPDRDEHDTIFQIADSSVPVYTSDILQLAADNIYLATVEPEIGPAFDGTSTPVNIIAANIFEEIERELWEELENIKQELEDEKDECESCGDKFPEGTLLEHLDGDISMLVCKECENDLLEDEDD